MSHPCKSKYNMVLKFLQILAFVCNIPEFRQFTCDFILFLFLFVIEVLAGIQVPLLYPDPTSKLIRIRMIGL